MLTWLRKIGIIKENMARPRRMKFGNGEITLSGYTPEEADKLQEHLNKMSNDTSVVHSPVVGDIVELKEEEIKVVDVSELTNTAIDLVHDKENKEFQLVFIKYNPVTKAAKVTETKYAGNFKLAASNNFKVELVTSGKI